jgi:hypothetical protein
MARFTKIITGSDAASVAAAVTTFLGTLVNPTIRGVTCQYSDAQRRVKSEIMVCIGWTDGGAALATPFQLQIIQKRKASDLESAINALFVANPLAFFPSVRYDAVDTADGKLSSTVGFVFFNATAGASANWLPL